MLPVFWVFDMGDNHVLLPQSYDLSAIRKECADNVVSLSNVDFYQIPAIERYGNRALRRIPYHPV